MWWLGKPTEELYHRYRYWNVHLRLTVRLIMRLSVRVRRVHKAKLL